MGYKNKSYQLSLERQVIQTLERMQAFGESKHNEKIDGNLKAKIFSASTYRTYKKHCIYFTNWIQRIHPEVTNLRKARKYMKEWLDMRTAQGLSAYTIQVEAKALAKLYGISPDDKDYYVPPIRHRADITRSRGAAVRDRNFNESKHADFVNFCKATGLRRAGIGRIRGCDLWTKDDIEKRLHELHRIPEGDRTPEQKAMLKACQDTEFFEEKYFIFVTEKGGRSRLAPIIGPHTDEVVARFRGTKSSDKVWQHVSTNADIHGYRAAYANALYNQYARALKDIPYDAVSKSTGRRYQSEVYVCRSDLKGRRFDRVALQKVEKALGHNSLHTFVQNYFRE